MKDASNNKTCTIHLRLSKEEKELIESVRKMMCDEIGTNITTSQAIRIAINNYNKINIR